MGAAFPTRTVRRHRGQPGADGRREVRVVKHQENEREPFNGLNTRPVPCRYPPAPLDTCNLEILQAW